MQGCFQSKCYYNSVKVCKGLHFSTFHLTNALCASDAMVAEVMEAVHHLDASFTAFYTAMTTEEDIESIAYVSTVQYWK